MPELLPSNGGVTRKVNVFGKQRNVSITSEQIPSIGTGLNVSSASTTNQKRIGAGGVPLNEFGD